MIECSDNQILMLSLASLILGIYILVRGADWTIESAIFFSKKLGISELVIGFTIIAFGTSLPELIVSVDANLNGLPGIAIGNVLGSNLANIMFVTAITAIVAPMVINPKPLRRDIGIMIFATALLTLLLIAGELSRVAGFIMISILVAYIFWQYRMAIKGEIEPENIEDPRFNNMVTGAAFLLLGLIFTAVGAKFLIQGAKVTASILGVPDAVIGLSIIALGTSLPELSTCIVAAMKKHGDIVIGNILGSNVFNILMIMGFVTAIKPIAESDIDPQVIALDVWVFAAVTLIFSAILLFYKKVSRPLGILLVLSYIIYIGFMYGQYIGDDILGTAGL